MPLAPATNVTNDTLLVEGTIDATNAPDPANMEQRIVNPDGFRTNLGKRDIRAVPGPLTASAKAGTSTYSSMLESPVHHLHGHLRLHRPRRRADREERRRRAPAAVAAGRRRGQPPGRHHRRGRRGRRPRLRRLPGRPDPGRAPTAGSASVIRSTDKLSAKVNWTPATAQPGAEPVSGYSIEAIPTTAGTNAEKAGIVVRTPAAATSTTLDGLTAAAAYDFEVRSMAGTAMSAPFTVGAVAGTPTGRPAGDTVIPTAEPSPRGRRGRRPAPARPPPSPPAATARSSTPTTARPRRSSTAPRRRQALHRTDPDHEGRPT